jgi:hypothetical protein
MLEPLDRILALVEAEMLGLCQPVAKLEADEARPVGASVTSDVTERRFTKTGQPSKSNQNARSAQDRPRLRVAAARSTGGRLAR